MVTENSLRWKLPACRSAAQVHRIFRTFAVGTVTNVVKSGSRYPCKFAKFRLTCQVQGEAPWLKTAELGDHDSVHAPCTVPYTPIRFPFVPGAPSQVKV